MPIDKKNSFKNKYVGEFVESPPKVRQRPCGCIEELNNETRIWRTVSDCTEHLKRKANL